MLSHEIKYAIDYFHIDNGAIQKEPVDKTLENGLMAQISPWINKIKGEQDYKDYVIRFPLLVRNPSFEEYKDFYHDDTEEEVLLDYQENGYGDYKRDFSVFEFYYAKEASGSEQILINGSCVLVTRPDYTYQEYQAKKAPEFITKLTEVIKDIVENIDEYNKTLTNLPIIYKKGYALRKDLELADKYFFDVWKNTLTGEDIRTFLDNLQKKPPTYFSQMTAQKFFDACYLCYKACQEKYEYDDSQEFPDDVMKALMNNRREERFRIKDTAKETYAENADGRCGYLLEIDENDPEAFEKWYKDEWNMSSDGRNNSHPSEIFRSSIYLQPYIDRGEEAKGYHFWLHENHNSISELVKCFNVLCANDIVPKIEIKKYKDIMESKDYIQINGDYGLVYKPIKAEPSYHNLPLIDKEKEKYQKIIMWPEIKKVDLQ